MLRACLCMLTGNPNESTNSFRGVNLNPGSRGATHPNSVNVGLHGYTSSLYELDGILYQIRYGWSLPPKNLWPPINSCIIKSSDGGRNWVDHLGRQNAPLPTGDEAMFQALPWTWMRFGQYGKGGAAAARVRQGDRDSHWQKDVPGLLPGGSATTPPDYTLSRRTFGAPLQVRFRQLKYRKMHPDRLYHKLMV